VTRRTCGHEVREEFYLRDQRFFFTCQTSQQSKSWSDDSMSFANNT
jgi:hypothetical protein